MSNLYGRILLTLLLGSCLVSASYAQTADPLTPLTAEQYVAAGDNYARTHQFDQAVDAYRQAIKFNPNLAARIMGRGASMSAWDDRRTP